MSAIRTVLLIEIIFLAAANSAFSEPPADDWPQWRGPDRSNTSRETGLLTKWPTNGPPLIWKVSGLGEGIASVSVAGARVFTVGNLDGSEFVFALEAKTGEKVWATRVGASIQEQALMRWLTQRTPTVDNDRLYTLTVSGELFCLRTADGQKLWQRGYTNDFGSRRPMWGFCDRPLVDGDKLICTPVGSEATIVALNKRTGELLWKTKLDGEQLQGYAALVIAEAGGIRQYVAFLANGLIGVAANDGRLLWRYDRPSKFSASSYTPLVHGDLICSPNGYGGGIVLIKLSKERETMKVEEIYRVSCNLDPFQDSTAVVGEHLYTVRAIGLPACFDFNTGKLVWDQRPASGSGRAALTYADGHLYIRYANGTMTLVEATPKGYIEKGAFPIPEHEQSIGVTFPVIAGGRLFLRDNNRLFCHDITAGALTKEHAAAKTVALSLSQTERQADETGTRPPRVGVNRAPDAVFVPTPQDVVERMLQVANVKKNDVVVDLGSGDGRIVITAARMYGCQAVGYEIDARLVRLSRESVGKENLDNLVRIEHKDIFTLDLSGADVVTVFLYPRLMERLIPQFEELKPGSRIVSHQFEMPGIKPDQIVTMDSKEDGDKHRLFLWTTPLRKE